MILKMILAISEPTDTKTLPVEAERCSDTFGEVFWIVRDPAGRVSEDESLAVAFERLAERQRTEVRGRPEISDWPARIAQEKARWEEAALRQQFGDLMADAEEESPGFVAAEALALRERGYVRESRTVKDSLTAEQAAYHDEFLREQTAANARPAPSEHRL